MKKILLLAILPLLLISCGKDDEPSQSSSKIIGVWYETGYYKNSEWHTWGVVSPPVHEFKDGGRYVYYSSLNAYKEGKQGQTGTYSFDGASLTVNGGYKSNITFTENGDNFTWEGECTCRRYK